MPYEMPEMLKTAEQLKPLLVGRSFKRIELSAKSRKLIEWGFINLDKEELPGRVISNVKSRDQYLYLELNDGNSLIIGELIGTLRYYSPNEPVPAKFTVKIELSQGALLVVNTTLYGYTCLLSPEQIREHENINPETVTPLDPEFSYEYFTKMLTENSGKAVKKLQSLHSYLSGFQNGYFQDIFFETGSILTARLRVSPEGVASP